MGRHDEARMETPCAQSAVPRRAVVGSGAAGVGLGIATFMLPSSTAAASTLEVATDAFAVLYASVDCGGWGYAPFLVMPALPVGQEYRFSFTGDPSGTWYAATSYTEDGWSDPDGDTMLFAHFGDPAGCSAVPPSTTGYLGRFTTGGDLIDVSQQFAWWDV